MGEGDFLVPEREGDFLVPEVALPPVQTSENVPNHC